MLCRMMLLFSLTVVVTLAGCTGGDDPAAPTVSVGETALPDFTLAPPPTHTPAPTAAPTRAPAPSPDLNRTPPPAAVHGAAEELAPFEIYARVSPSVASIHSLDGTRLLGTGFLIEGGYLVTNLHVVWPPFGEKSVVFPDGTQMTVPLAAWDPMSDIALLGPVNVTVPPLEFRDGEDLAVGSELFLLGYPGENDPSPEPAIVSGLLSQIREWEPLGITYFQTDAVVAGGQSGGVLVNARGELIGISGLRFTESNFAFVASAADLKPIIQQLALGQDPSGISNRELSLAERGHTFSGKLQNPWDTRTYLLAVPSGKSIELEVDSPGPLRFKVTDASGNVIMDGDNDSGGIARVNGEPPAGGFHFLTLASSSRFAGGSMDFHLTGNVPMFPQDDPDDGLTVVAPGAAAGAAIGSIDHYDDVDWYPVHLEEGETVRILASSLNVDTVLLVDSPNFRINQVTSDDDSGGGLFDTDSELVFRAPKAGEYYIVVEDFDGQSLGGYFLFVEQAPAGSEPVAVPPDPEEVNTFHGRMLVYESLLSDLSIQVPADWFQVWPDEEDSHIAFRASTADGDAAVIIFEIDLAAEGDFQTLDELTNSLEAMLLEAALEVNRERIIASSGDPAVVLHLLHRNEPGEVRLLTSIRDERFVIAVAYHSKAKGDESLRSLAEYSFGTLDSSGGRKAPETADRAILALLYNSTDGQNWENDDGWLSDQPIGEWYGVFTNANGRAVGLHLVGNQLSGVFPPELGSLSDLELLNLSDNRLGGAIPVELGSLKSLRSLYLNENDLTGDIPPVLGDLARLEILHLQFNNLTGEIPPELSNLARLRELDLGVNDLSGGIPPELGALGNLTSLWLGWNDLSGLIPPELANLGSLTRLWLDNSRLEGCLPDNLASQLDDQSNVGHLQICGERPLETSEQAEVQSRPIDLREYAARLAGGPGAIYVGDINQLVGPAPTVDQGDFDGNVPLGALVRHLWIYESPLYQELLEKARLTDPAPMTYDGPTITIRHVCINRVLLPCRLMETYLAPNLKERTNGKLEFVTSSFPELRLTGSDTLALVTDGTLESATIDGGYAGFELPPIEIQNLWGIYSSHEQEFEAAQAIIEDIEELVLAETGGVVMNHNWYAGNDRFFFCREKIDSLDGFAGKKTLSYSPALSDWVNGMGAEAYFLAFAEVYTAIERGVLDCAVAGAHIGYSQRWYDVTDYLIGPLSSFSSNNNVINAEKWASIPEDLQKILLEEAAKSELEALRIAGIQNEIGLIKNTTERWAGQDAMEFVPFSDEINYRSNTVLMQQVVPRWVNRVGGTEHPIIADTFNKKVGPIVGLRIEADWTVVKVPPAEATGTSE